MFLVTSWTRVDQMAVIAIGAVFLAFLVLVVALDSRFRKRNRFDKFFLQAPRIDEGRWVVSGVSDLGRFFEFLFRYTNEGECLVVEAFVGSVSRGDLEKVEDSVFDECLALMLTGENKRSFLQYVVGPMGKTFSNGELDSHCRCEEDVLYDFGIQITDGRNWLLLGERWFGRFHLTERVPEAALKTIAQSGVLKYSSLGER